MAEYRELHELFGDRTLLDKLEAACIIAAEGIRTEEINTNNHANRLIWARKAFQSPQTTAKKMLMALLAANKAVTVDNIKQSTDVAIQANVDAAVDVFADGS